MSTATELETEMLVRLLREYETEGRHYSAHIADVPEETGHYGLSDGLRGMGGGVTHNMRQSIQRLAAHRKIKRPIYDWLPDTDGGAALWLDGKIRCSRCPDKPIFDLDDIDEHGVKVHGDKRECEC